MKLMRGVVAVAAVMILMTPFAAAQAINIWKGAQCGGATIGPSGGPQGPCNFCDALIVGKNIVTLLLEFALIAATIMIVVGALTMMFAAGSEEKFATGKRTILNAVIGMAIALASWLIINTVIQFLAPGETNVPWANIQCS